MVKVPSVSRGSAPHRFDVDRLFRLVCALDDQLEMPVSQIEELLGRKSDEYSRFLQSGGLINTAAGVWTAGKGISFLSAALRNERLEEVKEALLEVPSFAAFADRVTKLGSEEYLDAKSLGRGSTTYRVLGEVTLICATVANSRIYRTQNVPSLKEFSVIARTRYSSLNRDVSDLVATGEWLEALIQHDGIHPEVAKQGLDAASVAGLLKRSTEGSTSQLRYRNRVLHVLRIQSGLPRIDQVLLYKGDYLIPGQASVSLRILESAP